MGLDTYKYEVIKNDSIIKGAIQLNELVEYSQKNNLNLICYGDFDETNNRLNDLFDKKFANNVGKVLINNYIDYKFYNEKHNCKITWLYEVSAFNYHNNVINYDLLTKYPEYKQLIQDKFKDTSEEDDIVLSFFECDDKIVEVTDDIKLYTSESKYLLFKSVEYQRSGDTTDLYDKFYGDCWYKKENCNLNESDKRWFIYKEELDELKSCFVEGSNIRSWQLKDDEIIYLNP